MHVVVWLDSGGDLRTRQFEHYESVEVFLEGKGDPKAIVVTGKEVYVEDRT